MSRQLEAVSRRAKVVRVEIEGEADDLALVDVALLVNDHVGNLLPFDPSQIRCIVLSRAEPAAVGTSPIGGLLEPAGPCDDWGVAVDLARSPDGQWTVEAFVNNATDEEVKQEFFCCSEQTPYAWGAQRLGGVRMSYNFK